MGKNGTGKSTLLKIITKNIKTDCKITNDFSHYFYLPQNPYYPNDIALFDYLSLVFFKNNWKWFLNRDEKNKINEVLELVNLSDKKDLCIQKLSGGEIQKANIAIGLLSQSDLFLLDEPASNMDLINQIKIIELLKDLTNKSITSVVIMHDLNLVSNYGDLFFGLGYNNSIISKNRDEFFTRENLKKIYDIDFEILKNNGKLYVQISD